MYEEKSYESFNNNIYSYKQRLNLNINEKKRIVENFAISEGWILNIPNGIQRCTPASPEGTIRTMMSAKYEIPIINGTNLCSLL